MAVQVRDIALPLTALGTTLVVTQGMAVVLYTTERETAPDSVGVNVSR